MRLVTYGSLPERGSPTTGLRSPLSRREPYGVVFVLGVIRTRLLEHRDNGVPLRWVDAGKDRCLADALSPLCAFEGGQLRARDYALALRISVASVIAWSALARKPAPGQQVAPSECRPATS